MKNYLKIAQKGIVFLFCAVLVLASSCSTSNRSNFSKKKYTNFRSAKSKTHKTGVEENDYAETKTVINQDLAEEKPEKAILLVEDELNSDIEEESLVAELVTLEENEILEKIIEEEPKTARPGKQEGGYGNRNNFELLSKEGKAQRMIEFNALFNFVAVFMAAGVIFALLGLLVFWLALIGAGFVFTGWIVSFVAATKVKRVNTSDKTKQFQNKYKWILFANWVGITACIIVFPLGIILLIVYLCGGL